MIQDCSPQLVLPMETKAFRVLKDVMRGRGFAITECLLRRFYVRLNTAAAARHILCFRATSLEGHRLVVIKLPQHPARIFRAECGSRCGAAVRRAAQQIAAGRAVNVSIG